MSVRKFLSPAAMNNTWSSVVHRRDGFTMIELLTVMVIAAIMVSLAVPAFGSYIDQTRTQSAMNRIVADVAYARLLATQQGRRTAIRFSPDGTYTLDTLTTAGTWSAARTVQPDEDMNGVVLSGGTTALEFSSRGLVTNHSNEVFLKVTRNEARDSVFISPAGRVYRAL
jgi:prepilin-type N-terminal cleavage/methylation domain-containing protein